MSKFFEELKRRNIIKEGIAYLVVAWMILQVASIVLPLMETPVWVMKALLIFLCIGFPVWLLIAWLYEVTPEGFTLESEIDSGKSPTKRRGNKLNRIIIGALVIAVALLLYDKFSDKRDNTVINQQDISISTEKSVAILPFENMSKDAESQVFCDGVMEDILTNLAYLKDLKVISRTSSMHYKETTKKLPEIAAELGVKYILEGSVRKYQNKVRLVAQLINAKDDSHLWANKFDRELELEKIFDIQSEIAFLIANALKVNITDKENKVLNAAHTSVTKAYESFLEGRALADARTVEGLTESVNKLEEAIKLDPKYSDALAELANSTWLLGYYSDEVDTQKAYAKAEKLANEALKINPDNSRAYSVLANIYFRTNRLDEVVSAFEKALELRPNDATTNHQYSIFYDNQGNTEKAFYHSQKSLAYDPLSLIVNFHYLNLLLSSGQLEQVRQHLEKISPLFENSEEQFSAYYGRLYMAEGNYEEAIKYFEKDISSSSNFTAGELGFCYAKIGNKEKALTYLNQVPEIIFDLNASIIHFALEEKDKAYSYLEKCVNEGIELGTIKNDPVFDPYRKEIQFQEIIDKINGKLVD